MTCGFQRPSEHIGHIGCASDSIVNELVPCDFCDRCPFHTDRAKAKRPIRGVGDVIAKAASAVGVKKTKGCGCGARQALLNRLLPLGRQSVDKSWTVIVTAAPRQEETLGPCVYSLRAAGWEPVVFAEPGTVVPDDVEVKWNQKRLGVWHNWLESVKWALGRTSADKILTVQDDTVFHPDSKSVVQDILWPSEDCGFVSLYTPKHYSLFRGTPRPVGVNRIFTKALWGACGLVWPRSILADVIEHDIAKRWLGVRPRSGSPEVWQRRRENPHMVQNSDFAIGRILRAMGRGMWFLDPSPGQHIATQSTIGHGDNTGRRNCGRCADWNTPLREQIQWNGEQCVIV